MISQTKTMRLAAILLGFLSVVPRALAQAGGIRLLEPIGGVAVIPTAGATGLGVFGFYFNLLYPWIIGMGAAISVLMGLVGGLQMMTAGNDSTKRSNGINRLLISMGGLLLILFSSTILNVLNPTFFM